MRALLAALLILPALSPGLLAEEPKPPMVYELRTYTTEPGKRPELLKRFRDHTMALFEKHGMTNVIYWTPVDDPDKLIYLLAHKSKAAGLESFAAFRKDPAWQKAFADSRRDGPLVKKVESIYLQPTDYTPQASVAEIVGDTPGLLYELRIYTTEPKRLAALNARFRDHTMQLFEKHGMTNIVYTTPVEEPLKSNTLVYVIAHQDRQSADASWKAFGGDPAWKEARDASQQDGPILVKNGVQRVYLTPTDFSPLK